MGKSITIGVLRSSLCKTGRVPKSPSCGKIVKAVYIQEEKKTPKLILKVCKYKIVKNLLPIDVKKLVSLTTQNVEKHTGSILNSTQNTILIGGKSFL